MRGQGAINPAVNSIWRRGRDSLLIRRAERKGEESRKDSSLCKDASPKVRGKSPQAVKLQLGSHDLGQLCRCSLSRPEHKDRSRCPWKWWIQRVRLPLWTALFLSSILNLDKSLEKSESRSSLRSLCGAIMTQTQRRQCVVSFAAVDMPGFHQVLCGMVIWCAQYLEDHPVLLERVTSLAGLCGTPSQGHRWASAMNVGHVALIPTQVEKQTKAWGQITISPLTMVWRGRTLSGSDSWGWLKEGERKCMNGQVGLQVSGFDIWLPPE